VEDRNDNAPVFQNLPYETSVLEVPSWDLAALWEGGSHGMGVPGSNNVW